MSDLSEILAEFSLSLSDLTNVLGGCYKATVSETLDGAGRIRVTCPAVYGASPNQKFLVSPVCEPAFPSPHDFTVPERGQVVWIMFQNGDISAPVWFGHPTKPAQIKVDTFTNIGEENPQLEDEKKEGMPLSVTHSFPVAEDAENGQVGGTITEALDRVIGTRFGSYLKFNDRGKEIVLELLGKTAVAEDRVGPKITLSMDDGSFHETDGGEGDQEDAEKNFSKIKIELPFGKDSEESPATVDKTELLLTNNSLDLKIRSIDASTDMFSLSVDATDDGGGKMDIKAAGGKTTISIDKEGVISITTTDNITLTTEKEFQISSGGGGGEEKAILGETLKGKLEDLITEIKLIQVSTPVGPSGVPLNAANFEVIKTGLTDILSEKTKNN